MKIYTRSGDNGETSLIYGRRVPKDSLRVETYGTFDEVNSVIGVAVALMPEEGSADLRQACQRLQRDLFDLGRDLATPEDKRDGFYVSKADVDVLEKLIDTFDEQTPPLRQFVLPGGSPAGAAFHQARTVARRAERRVVELEKREAVQPWVRKYLNRLSDLLFVMARLINARAKVEEPGVDFQGEKPSAFLEDSSDA